MLDEQGRLVPQASNTVTFSVTRPGELAATSNGDPTNGTALSSAQRDAVSGMAVAIVRALPGQVGEIVITATFSELSPGRATIASR